MSYKHLTINERNYIESSLNYKISIKKIAENLNYHQSTIYREIKRLPRVYNAYRAYLQARRKSKLVRRKIKITPEVLAFIINGTRKKWSPEQIIGSYSLQYNKPFPISVSTIYRYFKRGLFQLDQALLRHKGKYRKRYPHENKREIKRISTISRNKAEFGHWEIDTIVGKNNQSKRLTITEILTNLTFTIGLKTKTAQEVTKKIVKIFSSQLINHFSKSIVVDNGAEFTNWKMIETKTGIPVYFTDPGRPWQKPSIEHANKLIREYMPKKSNLNLFTKEDDIKIFASLNNRPRKKLGFKTPLEVFTQLISII